MGGTKVDLGGRRGKQEMHFSCILREGQPALELPPTRPANLRQSSTQLFDSWSPIVGRRFCERFSVFLCPREFLYQGLRLRIIRKASRVLVSSQTIGFSRRPPRPHHSLSRLTDLGEIRNKHVARSWHQLFHTRINNNYPKIYSDNFSVIMVFWL